MPLIDLGPAPEDYLQPVQPIQETGLVDLGPAPQTDLTTGQKIGAVKQFIERTQEQIKAEAKSVDRYKIQRLLSLNPNLTPEQAERGAIGLTSSIMDTATEYAKKITAGEAAKAVRAKLELQLIYGGGGTGEEKKEAAEQFKKQAVSEAAREFQLQAQDVADAESMLKDQESLKGEFIAKTARRWDRGIVNTIGGGLYFLDTLTRAMDMIDIDMGDMDAPGGYAARARVWHDMLQAPVFQPVVENAFDKYFGAAAETAPFMITTTIPHVLSGGATMPAYAGSFLVAFGIEGNNAAQATLDRGGSTKEANMRGFIVGLFNGIIEIAGGSGGKFVKSDMARKVTSKLMRAKVITKEYAKNMLKEGFLEELPQEFIHMTAGGSVPRNSDGTVDWNAAFNQGWDAALTGTILGGAFGVPGTISAAVKTKVQKKGVPLVNVPTTLAEEIRAKEAVKEGETKYIDTVVGKVPVSADIKNIPNPTPIQTSVIDRNIKLRIAHQIAKKMGMKAEEFEIYKQTYGEQSSMADMTDEQLDDLLGQLQQDGTAAGLTAEDVIVKATPAEELLKQVKSSRHYKHETEAQKREREPGILRMKYDAAISKWHGFWASQDRVRNIVRKLDNYMDGGPATRYIWDAIKKARSRKEQSWNIMMRDVQKKWADGGVDIAKMQDTKRKDVIVDKNGKGFSVSDTERIGLYLVSKDKEANKKVSGWFEDNNIDSKKAFDAITKSVESNEQEKLVADTIAEYFETRSPAFFAAAEIMGIEIEIIKNYFPLLSVDPDLSTGEDVVELFLEHFENQLQVPGKQHTKKRTGGTDKVEWDAIKIFTRVSNRMESLIEVGPVAQQVYKLVKSKGMREAINDATFGKGADIIQKWIRDSARGTSAINTDALEKIISGLRTNAVQYTLGLKLFTSAPKAMLSFLNGLASEPAMIPYAMEVLAEYRTLGGIKRIQDEVYSKSTIMENRNAERDIRTMWNDKTIRKFFAGKKLSPFGLRYWSHTDAATANAIWLAAYRLARGRGKNMSEADARIFADNRAQESQPMASVEDLPDVFRGSELSKAVTTFMGMLNTTQQYLKHDIIGEYRAGKISGTKASYRFMMGEVLPAMVLGVIVRGRLPETPGEMAEDLISYLIYPAIFLGRFLFNVATGNYDPVTTSISMMPLRAFEEAVRTTAAVKKGDVPGIVEGAARTYGAATGQIPEQAIITARGAYDLATGESDDWRRLMRTESSLKYHASKKETSRSATRRKPSARRKPSGQRRTRQTHKRRSRS